MKYFLLAVLMVSGFSLRAENKSRDALTLLADERGIAFTVQEKNRNAISLTVTSNSSRDMTVLLFAGRIFSTVSGEKKIVFKTSKIPLPAREELIIDVPVLAVSSTTASAETPPTIAHPDLAPLFALFDATTDLPLETAQLAVFIATEDMTLARWNLWLTGKYGTGTDPLGPENLVRIIDALALVKLSFPEKKIGMLEDGNLKRQALRIPATRPKAMALFGLKLDMENGDAGAIPDLKQLLHTAPGDNCPTCRRRAELQKDIGL